jgi:hypothetical protein
MKIRTLLCTSLLALAAAGAGHAGQLTINGFTAGTPTNTNITASPVGGTTGNTIATGFDVTFDTESFIAWCLDLEHSVSAGGPFQYMPTAAPFGSSFLAAGAVDRVQSVFDANRGGVNAFDAVQAAAFQLSLWEVAYDDDFNLASGAFQGAGIGGNGAAITATAGSYLTAASGFMGNQRYRLLFLESDGMPQYQNLVTATEVPLPAAGPLLVAGAGALAALRRRRKAA